MHGRVEHLHIVRVKRAAPQPIDSTELTPGRGIPGDHHDRPGIRRAVTLIQGETLDRVASTLGNQPAPGRSRRNITTRGIELDALAEGTLLRVGSVILEVRGPCEPCKRMEKALGSGALALMEGQGGIVAQVVRAGIVRRGDSVEILTETRAIAAGA
jgi:MOSC domain-containing protein YiiM